MTEGESKSKLLSPIYEIAAASKGNTAKLKYGLGEDLAAKQNNITHIKLRYLPVNS